MMEGTMERVSRRSFIGSAGSAVLPLTARAYSRIVGANDRIQIAQIGCGNRAFGHRQMLELSSQTVPNFDLRSVCDLWTVNREKAADSARQESSLGDQTPDEVPVRAEDADEAIARTGVLVAG